MNKKSTFLSERIDGIGYAIKGAFLLLKTEASIQIQVVIAIIMTGVGFYFKLSKTEWIAQIFAIVLVITIEGINTAIEALSDFVHAEQHKKIGFIKDISAGAVFISALAAIIVGLIIYLPKF